MLSQSLAALAQLRILANSRCLSPSQFSPLAPGEERLCGQAECECYTISILLNTPKLVLWAGIRSLLVNVTVLLKIMGSLLWVQRFSILTDFLCAHSVRY